MIYVIVEINKIDILLNKNLNDIFSIQTSMSIKDIVSTLQELNIVDFYFGISYEDLIPEMEKWEVVYTLELSISTINFIKTIYLANEEDYIKALLTF